MALSYVPVDSISGSYLIPAAPHPASVPSASLTSSELHAIDTWLTIPGITI